jgi:hypothetical protein
MSQYTIVPEAPASTVRYPILRVLLAGLVAIGLSIVTNLAIRWIGMLFVEVPADLQPLQSIQPIIFFSFLFILVATVVWFIITRVSRTPLKTWNMAVLIGFVLSILPDISMPMMDQPVPGMGTFTWPATLILITMHVASGLITWWALPRFSRE